jgi:hypothetical protein
MTGNGGWSAKVGPKLERRVSAYSRKNPESVNCCWSLMRQVSLATKMAVLVRSNWRLSTV